MLMGIREFNSACSGVRIAYSKFSTAVTISVSRFAQRFSVFLFLPNCVFLNARGIYVPSTNAARSYDIKKLTIGMQCLPSYLPGVVLGQLAS